MAMINPENRGVRKAAGQGKNLALAPSTMPTVATAITMDQRNTST